MRKCFLHIGTHKTGTTSIQLMLSREHAALKDAGFVYPMTGRLAMPADMMPEVFASEAIPTPGGQHNIAWRLLRDHRYRGEFGTAAELYREIEASGENVILSSEDFVYALLSRFEEFKGFVEALQSIGLQVSVIVYLRDPVDCFRSGFMELVNQRTKVSFEEFFEIAFKNAAGGMFDYDRILTNLESLPGVTSLFGRMIG